MSSLTGTELGGSLKVLLLLFISIFFLFPSEARHYSSEQSHPPSQHLHERVASKPLPLQPGLGDFPANSSALTVNDERDLIKASHRLVKRAVDYRQYVCKGAKALDMIIYDPPTTRKWTQQDLDDGGWSIHEDSRDVAEAVVPALDGLGVPHAPSDIRPVFAGQYREFKDRNGKTGTPATNGFYNSKYIVGTKNKGAIVAEANFSPTFQRQRAGSKAEIPALNRWSDVVWFLWSKEAGDQAGNLRYIFRDNARNEVTRAIIEKIHGLEDHPDTLDLPWPGRTYDMRTEDGKALLATPQGIGVAYLIKDHSDVLGRKIPLARVFTVDNRPPAVSGSSDSGDESESSSSSDSDSSDSSSSSSGASSGGPPVYKWDYYVVWELRDTARGDYRPTTTS